VVSDERCVVNDVVLCIDCITLLVVSYICIFFPYSGGFYCYYYRDRDTPREQDA